MTARERVNAALDFQPVDYIPRYDLFWGGFIAAWRKRQGMAPLPDPVAEDIEPRDAELRAYYHLDVLKVAPLEDTAPAGFQVLKRDGKGLIVRDGWGRIVRQIRGSPYGEVLEAPLSDKTQLDVLRFDSPLANVRFTSMLKQISEERDRLNDPYIFIKVGGPYLRSSFLRGEMQWYLDILEDRAFTVALASRISEHLTAVGVEALRRAKLAAPSIWIFDDVAGNRGPLVSPIDYENLFLPSIRNMVHAFKGAGARHVGFHSDGDIRPLLDGLVDAGVTIINPVEPRAGMDVVQLRNQYGKRLGFVGGLCNSKVLPFGTDVEVRHHIEHIMSIAAESGFVVGSHTISNDISVERYDLTAKILAEYGRPMPG